MPTIPAVLQSTPRIGLAPMEGVIDATTRMILSAHGGFDWIVTEFVRVVDQRLPPRVFMRICPELAEGARTSSGVPVHLQLLGSDPYALGENARQAVQCGARAIDLNFGCPAKLVNRHGGGASLLRDPRQVFAAVSGVVRALEGDGVPVSAKLRLGFDDKRLALECARAAEEAGAHRLTVHARTKREAYRPPAHWEWVARIRQAARVPVVVNGDIWTIEDYWKARSLSGCEDAMIGRGALADPWLAARIRHWHCSGTRLPATTWAMRASTLVRFAERLETQLAGKVVVSLLKQWMAIMRQHDEESALRFAQLRRITERQTLIDALRADIDAAAPREPLPTA